MVNICAEARKVNNLKPISKMRLSIQCYVASRLPAFGEIYILPGRLRFFATRCFTYRLCGGFALNSDPVFWVRYTTWVYL